MNPLFKELSGASMGGPMNMMQQLQKFRAEMQGKDPRAEINKLLQSGRISQQQLNQAQQMAQQVQMMFGGKK